MTGAILIGVTTSCHINKVEAGLSQLGVQVFAVVIVAVYASAVTYIILKAPDFLGVLRVPEIIQMQGLDEPMYGEDAYNLWDMDRLVPK